MCECVPSPVAFGTPWQRPCAMALVLLVATAVARPVERVAAGAGFTNADAVAFAAAAPWPPPGRTVVLEGAACAELLNASSNVTSAERGATPTDVFARVAAGFAHELRGCVAEGLWGVALRVELGAGAFFVIGGSSRLQLGGLTVHGPAANVPTPRVAEATIVVEGGSTVDVRRWATDPSSDVVPPHPAALAIAFLVSSAGSDATPTVIERVGMAVVGESRVTARCFSLAETAACDAAAVALALRKTNSTLRGRVSVAVAGGSTVIAETLRPSPSSASTMLPVHSDARAAAAAVLVGAHASNASIDGDVAVSVSGGSAVSVRGRRGLSAAGGIGASGAGSSVNVSGSLSVAL
eukprot:CAMPEP_0174845320 /NCGR_PEP_ID=MMETSP1114-20130205/11657_1 /TAXON_ID=312471 /ORGANISM="Neobodo designis, Strain CCAP 1951/1" /LENGTH=351 /DNA_ID=CAMNT_0016079567 /DNA_START=125 /DNA_END=1176 /DNA_ORIENTATION=-